MAEGSCKSDDRLNCSICLEKFKKPKLLSCFHTFCVTCIDTYIEKNRRGKAFHCPLCRTSVEIPEKGAEGFQSNFYILEEEGTHALQFHCDVCEETTVASHTCMDCQENMCDTCAKSHMRMKVSRDHKMVEVSSAEGRTQRKFVGKVFCATHPTEETKFVCKQCDNKLLCIVCKLTDHENHTTKDIPTAAAEIRCELLNSVEDGHLNVQLSQIKNEIQELANKEERALSVRDEDLASIKEQSQEMYAAIDRITKAFESSVSSQFESSISLLKTQRLQLETEMKSLSSLQSTAQMVLEQDSDVDILMRGQALRNQLDQVKGNKYKTSSSLHSNLFTKGIVDDNTLSRMFGTENTYTKRQNRSNELNAENLAFIAKIQVEEKKDVRGIVPTKSKPDQAWICCWDSSNIYLVNTGGKCIESLNIGAECHQIAAKDGVEFVASCHDAKCIKEVTFERKVNTILSGLDLHPHGITFRKSSASRKQDLIYTCATLRYSGQGETRLSTSCGHRGNAVCKENSHPIRVACEPVTGAVCLTDVNNHLVTIHDSNFKLMSKVSDEDIKYPLDVQFYSPSCVVIVNQNNSIITLNLDCRKKKVLMSGKAFQSVAFDDHDRMWVGLGNGIVEVYSFK